MATLDQAIERIPAAAGEMIVDLSTVDRLDAEALRKVVRLAALAEEKSVRVVLSGVKVEVYKVLKLVKVAPRFSFVN